MKNVKNILLALVLCCIVPTVCVSAQKKNHTDPSIAKILKQIDKEQQRGVADSIIMEKYYFTLAEKYRNIRDYTQALSYIEPLLVYYRRNNDMDNFVKVLLPMAEIYKTLGMKEEIIPFLQEAKFYCEYTRNFGRRYIITLVLYSEAEAAQKNRLKARMLADAAWYNFERYAAQHPTGNIDLKREVIDNRCLRYIDCGQIDFALDTIWPALDSIHRVMYDKRGANVLHAAILSYADLHEELYHLTADMFLSPEERYQKYQEKMRRVTQYYDLMEETLGNRGNEAELKMQASLDIDSVAAYQYAKQAATNLIERSIPQIAFLTPDELEIWMHTHDHHATIDRAILQMNCPLDSNGIVYTNALFWKGIQLRKATSYTETILRKGTKQEIAQLKQIEQYKKQLQDNDISEEERIQLIEDITLLERPLMNHYADKIDVKKEMAKYSWKKVQKQLKKHDAAIEFIMTPTWNKQVKKWTYDNPIYYALVIRKDYTYPKIIRLGDYKKLHEPMVHRFTGTSATEKLVGRLYANGNSRGDKLYNLLWKPIEQELQGVENIYFSPVGFLNSIALQAIHSNHTPIFESYNLYQVSSTLEIERIKKEESTFNLQSAVVYGGIIYESHQDSLAATVRGQSKEFPYFLEATVNEAHQLTNMFDSAHITTTCKQGLQADEESFKALSNQAPHLIHIATHGFFLADEKKAAIAPFIQLKQQHQQTNDVPSPMQRAGLMFAGSKPAWTGTNVIKDVDDGILTAEEIATMNLLGTEIIVLSACETGLGEMQTSEGVFGLQRAFKLAGVETLVMSLWQVHDAATQLLMETFYANWLNGKTKHDAFKAAIQTVKAQPEYASPYYWAGFIMVD